MNRTLHLTLVLLPLFFILGACTESPGDETETQTEFEFDGQILTVPAGFKVERIAGPPLVDRPMEADFDDSGRLFVSDSSGFSGRAPEQYKRKSHRIMRLTDTNGDGKFDESTVFADGLMLPEGILCHEGAVYVAAPPVIWKLVDSDNNGVADQRTVWHDGKTMTGCANDLHGPYLGPDGWFYWCKGAFAEQTYDRPGRGPTTDSAAHIYRRRPDGSGSDTVMSGGMDNPVGIAFTVAGDLLFTTTFYSHPRAGRRDALVHAIYGGVYPKVHGVLDGLVRTGELLPAMTHLGPAVPCGITRYRSRTFGAEYRGNLFSCHFNLRRVQRHVLRPVGATFQTEDSDFLVSDNPEFHPTDVFEDADGSLIVIDTGGWYRICCPSSQIAKPDVLGGIFRISRIGTAIADDPRGRHIRWQTLESSALARLLDDPRPAVRKRAIAHLAKKGNGAVAALADVLERSASDTVRLNAIWALTRIDDAAARGAVRGALDDSSATVRQAAVHSAGVHRDSSAVSGLLKSLRSPSPHLRRSAATALAQIRDRRAVSPLHDVLGEPSDRTLEHALIYALIEIGDADAVREWIARSRSKGESRASRRRHRAALIALDQMDGGKLQADEVVPLLTSKHPTLRETATWIVGFHPEWGGTLTDYFRQRLLAAGEFAEGERGALRDQLARFTGARPIQELIASILRDIGTSDPVLLTLLSAIAKARPKRMPSSWTDGIHRCLKSPDPAVLAKAVTTLRAVPAARDAKGALRKPLLGIASATSHPVGLRLAALDVLASERRALEPQLFSFLLKSIAPTRPPLDRIAAARVLEVSKLDNAQLSRLVDAIETANPMEFSKLLGAFRGCSEESIGLELVRALERSDARSALRPETLRPLLAKFSSAVQKRGEDLLASSSMDAAKQKARLDELERALAGGDKGRGHLVFNGAKAACSACHSIGYVGGDIGPDLTHIGKIRTERDLLESIVYPSSNFVRSYEPVILGLRDGKTYYGMLKQASADSVVLVVGPGADHRFAKSEITEIDPGTVSLMPPGVDKLISKQELADLITFLKSLR